MRHGHSMRPRHPTEEGTEAAFAGRAHGRRASAAGTLGAALAALLAAAPAYSAPDEGSELGSYLDIRKIAVAGWDAVWQGDVMARQLRQHFAGGWYHITTRGMGRLEIFSDDRDREHFIGLAR